LKNFCAVCCGSVGRGGGRMFFVRTIAAAARLSNWYCNY
jgi:hypothetical protein